jgi:acyl-CoA synthetase (AMP-forming)/AMP-acid ligase II
VDHAKDIISSSRGETISSVEVENVLYMRPAVLECEVIAVPDEKWGEIPQATVAQKPNARQPKKNGSISAASAWPPSRPQIPLPLYPSCPKPAPAKFSSPSFENGLN